MKKLFQKLILLIKLNSAFVIMKIGKLILIILIMNLLMLAVFGKYFYPHMLSKEISTFLFDIIKKTILMSTLCVFVHKIQPNKERIISFLPVFIFRKTILLYVYFALYSKIDTAILEWYIKLTCFLFFIFYTF